MSEPEWVSVPSRIGEKILTEVAITRVRGKLQPVGIRFSAADGEGLRSTDVRASATGVLAAAVRAYAAKHGLPDPTPGRALTNSDPAPRRRGRPRRYSTEHYVLVAEKYRQAWAITNAPTKAVAEAFGVAHSTAAKWVMHARAKGLLEDAPPL